MRMLPTYVSGTAGPGWCFTGRAAGMWLTKQGSDERDTLLTAHTKVLQGFGWGFLRNCYFATLTSRSNWKIAATHKLYRLVSRVRPLAVRWHWFWWLFCLLLFLYAFFLFRWLKKKGFELSWTAFEKCHLKLTDSRKSKWKGEYQESNREQNGDYCWGLLQVCVMHVLYEVLVLPYFKGYGRFRKK